MTAITEERAALLQDVSDIIRSASLHRGAVESSTPEQIVWMTKQVIEENLIAWANGEEHRYRWMPTVYGVVADIRRAIYESRLAKGPKAMALLLIDRAASGWPA